MSLELTLRVAGGDCKVFLQEGFYLQSAPTSHIHKHPYTEVHLVTDGQVTFRIENTETVIGRGELLVVPRHLHHCCIHADPGVRHTAFQIDCTCAETSRRAILPEVSDALFSEIAKSSPDADHTAIVSYLTLICFSVLDKRIPAPKRTSDQDFLIHEFFSQHYVLDVRLKDLADELHLSERQAERLVIEHTGNTFRRELTRRRTEMAVYLMQNSTMSLTEIARYVGYRSYAGFWKAMQRIDADEKNADAFLQNGLEKPEHL